MQVGHRSSPASTTVGAGQQRAGGKAEAEGMSRQLQLVKCAATIPLLDWLTGLTRLTVGILKAWLVWLLLVPTDAGPVQALCSAIEQQLVWTDLPQRIAGNCPWDHTDAGPAHAWCTALEQQVWRGRGYKEPQE
jgi:hypothetical protein